MVHVLEEIIFLGWDISQQFSFFDFPFFLFFLGDKVKEGLTPKGQTSI
jgi:hypothetical protein